ncbi:MAG: hypothetical protein OES70_11210, partial [Desulfobacterales bacterium]|nr:hypothetical protein [Desulfobacterales bacterium]
KRNGAGFQKGFEAFKRAKQAFGFEGFHDVGVSYPPFFVIAVLNTQYRAFLIRKQLVVDFSWIRIMVIKPQRPPKTQRMIFSKPF